VNTNKTETSSVSGAFGTVTQAGNPAPRKSMAVRRKVVKNPGFPFGKAITPELILLPSPTDRRELCSGI
jgi:hypothetical protein